MEARESVVEVQIVGTAEMTTENGTEDKIEATETLTDGNPTGETLGIAGTIEVEDMTETQEIV